MIIISGGVSAVALPHAALPHASAAPPAKEEIKKFVRASAELVTWTEGISN